MSDWRYHLFTQAANKKGEIMKTIAEKKAELIAEESKEVFGNFYIPLEEKFIKKLYSLT